MKREARKSMFEVGSQRNIVNRWNKKIIIDIIHILYINFTITHATYYIFALFFFFFWQDFSIYFLFPFVYIYFRKYLAPFLSSSVELEFVNFLFLFSTRFFFFASSSMIKWDMVNSNMFKFIELVSVSGRNRWIVRQ